MKKITRKTNLVIVALLLCLMVNYTVHAQAKMVNFAGTWSLNEDKSDFGRLTAGSASRIKTLQITQTTVAITINSGDETMKATAEIGLSDAPSRVAVSEVISGIPNTLTANIKLEIINSRSFKIANRDPLGQFAMQKKTYSLSDDGKTLAITYEYENDKGEQLLAGKLVYNK